MNDRELLEMAAKAAGYPICSDAKFVQLGGGTPRLYMGNNGPVWSPLTDDGDALRLAVKLHLKPVFHPALNQAIVRPYYASEKEWVEDGEKHPDPYTATRRAIVRAAAEIGRSIASASEAAPNGEKP